MTLPSGYRRIETSQRLMARGARKTGPADPNEVLSVSIRIRRRADAPSLPDPAALSATPVGERRYLSREDFAEHYGAAQEDLDKIAGFARNHGLTVVESSIRSEEHTSEL